MSFDRLAPYYEWMEAVLAGQRLQQVRSYWLNKIPDNARILSVGEGHGPFSVACALRHPRSQITCVDASAAMLARAKQRAARAGITPDRINWVCTDVFSWKPVEDSFDVIATHFFLDCFPPEKIGPVVAKLAACARPNASWLLSDFTIPAHGLSRWRALAVHKLMYAFFRFATHLPAQRLTPPDDFIRQHGFQLKNRAYFDWGLLHADLWQRNAGDA